MIQLFKLPEFSIDSSKYNHLLHGNAVKEFEKEFADYVGAKYACSVNSCTNAIFLALHRAKIYDGVDRIEVRIPSIIPPVVVNAVVHSGCDFTYANNIDWVGGSYTLARCVDYDIIDSAQRVDRNQFSDFGHDNALMLFSFFPTKPVGSIDGGMIVSNDKEKIDWFRIATMNGMTTDSSSWDRSRVMCGWKMYMSTVQCDIALDSLRSLDARKARIAIVREYYNESFGIKNASDHLYRIVVDNNQNFIDYMRNERGIICGVHYKAMTKTPMADRVSTTTASIPMHYGLSHKDVDTIVDAALSYITKNCKHLYPGL
jgi:dTDP-4-amino-4,6-dideoxygalactose transaminase